MWWTGPCSAKSWPGERPFWPAADSMQAGCSRGTGRPVMQRCAVRQAACSGINSAMLPRMQGAQGPSKRGVGILVRSGAHGALPQPARPAGGGGERQLLCCLPHHNCCCCCCCCWPACLLGVAAPPCMSCCALRLCNMHEAHDGLRAVAMQPSSAHGKAAPQPHPQHLLHSCCRRCAWRWMSWALPLSTWHPRQRWRCGGTHSRCRACRRMLRGVAWSWMRASPLRMQ